MSKLFYLWQGDITKLNVECIVNASNPLGLGCHIPGHCIDSAIHLAAGPKLLEECKLLNGVPTGVAKITLGYDLPATYIIHVTGPKKIAGTAFDWTVFSKCYINVLELAKKHDIKEIAFCCLSTGLYGYPQQESAIIAVNTVTNWITNTKYKFDKIIFNVFTDTDFVIYKSILN